MDETDLALLREEIDSIDMEIVSLLESRLLISAEIGNCLLYTSDAADE